VLFIAYSLLEAFSEYSEDYPQFFDVVYETVIVLESVEDHPVSVE
jgi:hypothetical protein